MTKRKGYIRWFVYSLTTLLLLPGLLFIFLTIGTRIPAVQSRLTYFVNRYVETRIKSPFHIDRIVINFPKTIVIEGVRLQDQKMDTLLAVKSVAVNTNLWGLLHKSLFLKSVTLNGLRGSVSRNAQDSTFNYSYIVDAFSGHDATTDTTSSSSWTFSMSHLSLYQTRLNFDDTLSSFHVLVISDDLAVDFDNLDLACSRMDVRSIAIKNGSIKIKQGSVQSSPNMSADSSSLYAVTVHQIDIDSLAGVYNDFATGMTFTSLIGKLSATVPKMDLSKDEIGISRLSLDNSYIYYRQPREQPGTPDTLHLSTDTSFLPIPYTISLGRLDVNNAAFRIYQRGEVVDTMKADANIRVSGFSTHIRNLEASSEKLQASVRSLSFDEGLGIQISSFSSEILLNKQHLRLADFSLATEKSDVHMDLDVRSVLRDDLRRNPGAAKIKLSLEKTILSPDDFEWLSPSIFDNLHHQLRLIPNVRVNSRCDGTVDKLRIIDFQMSTLDHTQFSAKGYIENLLQPGSSIFTVDEMNFHTSSNDLNRIASDPLLSKTLSIPELLSLTGQFRKDPSSISGKFQLSSNAGSARLEGKMMFDSVKNYPYQFHLTADSVALGRLLRDSLTYGSLTLDARVTGSGFSMDSLQAAVQMDVKQITYQGYAYRDLKINGTFKKYLFEGSAGMTDKNIDFQLHGNFDYTADIPRYKMNLDLKHINFNGLHLTERPLVARGLLTADLTTADFMVINGNVAIRKVAIYNGEALYTVDSLLFASIQKERDTEIDLQSDLISGKFEGTIRPGGLPATLSQHLDRYFNIMPDSGRNEEPQNFKFNLELKQTRLLTDIIFPSLKEFSPGPLTGSFNSTEGVLDISLKTGKIHYDEMGTDSLRISITSDPKALLYSMQLQNFVLDTFKIHQVSIEGRLAENVMHTQLFLLDSLNQTKLLIGSTLASTPNGMRFHLVPDQLILDYLPWHAAPSNSITLSKGRLTASDFLFGRNEEQVEIRGSSAPDSLLTFRFRRVLLNQLTALLTNSDSLVTGELNGSIDLTPDKAIKANIIVNKFGLFHQTWGDIHVEGYVDADRKNHFALVVAGGKLDIKGQGEYHYAAEPPSIEVDAVINKIDLIVFKPFLQDQLNDLTGSVTGKIRLRGEPSHPQLSGQLTFESATAVPLISNSSMHVENQEVSLANGRLLLDQFTILDQNKNSLILTGWIGIASMPFDLHLKASAHHFQILNTTENVDSAIPFYGKVGIDAEAMISGKSNLPVIELGLGFTDKSNFTYRVSAAQQGVMESKGIVEFVDRDIENDPYFKNVKVRDTTVATFTGIELSAKIHVTDDETFNIIVDPSTGDELSVQGNGELTFGLSRIGDMTLTGRYELTKGSYHLSFHNVIQREFEIEKGSTITWTGDPLNGELNIVADYKTEAAPYELVVNQFTSSDEGEINAYKQRMPFIVHLQMHGELMAPQIAFQIDMPEDQQNALGGNVYARIQDINSREAELDKQVFALLLLKHFIADNPFTSAGNSLAGTARRSVSRILTDQLNQLTSNIKGLNLTFDVKSDERYTTTSTSGETSLQLGVSQQFLNQRLSLKLAGNVNIEGENKTQGSFSDYLGDIVLEYQLTEDGRLLVNGFRKSDFDMIDGELIETGVGMIYNKDYNSLHELFKASPKAK